MPILEKKKNVVSNASDVQAGILVEENVVAVHLSKLIYICEDRVLREQDSFYILKIQDIRSIVILHLLSKIKFL